jgi:uncharacterized protein (DUF2147 family)
MLFRLLLLALVAAFVASVSAPALAAGPEGLWLVKDQTGRIRIEKCNNVMWGSVAWQKEPSKDGNNPNPALKDRPIVGIAILIGMSQTEANLWEGNIYNPRNGNIYKSKMSMQGEMLDIKGCVLGGLICGGEAWTRLADNTPGTAPKNNCAVTRQPR